MGELIWSLLSCANPPTLVAEATLCQGDDTPIAVAGSALDPVVLDPLGDATLAPPRLEFRQADLHLPAPLLEGDEPAVDGSSLSAGLWELVAIDAYGDETSAGPGVLVAGAPQLHEATPEEVCAASGDTSIALWGSDFLDGTEVVVGPYRLVPDQLEDCASGPLGASCEHLMVTLPADALALGANDLHVETMCGTSAPLSVDVHPAPTVEAVSPPTLCVSGGDLTVLGTDFPLDVVGWIDGEEVPTERWSSTELRLVAPELDAGEHSLVVGSPDGECLDEFPGGLRVTEAPLVFDVDPPVVYANLPQQVTAFVADLSGEVTDAWIEDGDGAIAVDWTWSAEDPSRLVLDLPDLDAGDYQVLLDQDGDCAAIGAGGFTVTSTLGLALDTISPSQAWTFDTTAVEVRAKDPLPADREPFADTPRLYLVGPGDTGQTTPLLGVAFRSGEELAATLPDGLDVGTYTLVAINPSGALGVAWKSVEVLWDAPPTITGITPASLDKSSDERLTLTGRNFRDPTVGLSCRDGGADVTLTTTPVSWSYGSVDVDLPASGLNQATCVVELENADGTTARFASISVRNPSQNLFGWDLGPELVEARRAPASAVGRTSSVNRWLYVLGGDEGDASTARNTLEVSRIGVYGDAGAFDLLTSELPRNRTRAQAVALGPFLYLIGGHNGTKATDTTYRAHILDPLDAPLVDGVSFESAGSGLAPGSWQYRVSARFDATDTINPAGESLAGPPVHVTLPELDGALKPTLAWTEVDRAVGYRVYRSPSADTAGFEWLADVTLPTFTDAGDATDGSQEPLSEGAVGEWARLDSLTTAREGHCLALAPDPQTDPEIWWLYAAGGRDEDGTPLASIERLDIQVNGPDSQTTGGWSTLDDELSEARYDCAGFTLDSTWHSVVEPGESWVYFAGGENGSTTTGAVDVGQLEPGGELSSWGTVDSMSPARSGFVHAAASDYLHAFGGQKGEPSSGGVSAEVIGPPDLRNWNNQGVSLQEGRHLAGSAAESGVLFALGGATDDLDATTSTETTNW